MTPTRARLREIENEREMSATNCLIRLKLYKPRLPEASRTKPISIAKLQAEIEIRYTVTFYYENIIGYVFT